MSQVSVAFGRRTVLARVNLSISQPGTYALMGPSGSGKSTLLGLIAGEIKPTAGTCRVDGLSRVSPAEWLVQSTPLLTKRTAIANVMLGPLSVGATQEEAQIAAHEVLATLRLSQIGNMPVHTLSGGERQRVAIGRCLATRPSLVLADEPTASLDPVSRLDVCEALSQLAGHGAVVIIATHDSFVADQCTTVLVLEDGHLVSRRSP